MTLLEATEMAKSSAYWGIVCSSIIGIIAFIVSTIAVRFEIKNGEGGWAFLSGVSALVGILCIIIAFTNLTYYENPKAHVTDIDRAGQESFTDYHWELVPNKTEGK